MDEYEYFKNKRDDKVYLSKRLYQTIYDVDDKAVPIKQPVRIVSKIINSQEGHEFIKDGAEVSLRITSGGKQEIKAKFYEDTRGIFTLTIQKYTIETGAPHKAYFTFTGDELTKLFNILKCIKKLPIHYDGNIQYYDDELLENAVSNKEQLLKLINAEPELLEEILKSEITQKDIINLGYRKKQLDIFNKLLSDDIFFEQEKQRLDNAGDEKVWQVFFEKNTWIFGYGLNYYLNTPLNGEKLEQVVSGFDFNSTGKRVDALLKTQGIVSSLSFGEIKTHRALLLKKQPYRRECWSISDELAGGVAQIQKTVQLSLSNLNAKTEVKDGDGNLTGEQLFLYHPRSFLVIGSLKQFNEEHGINKDKYSSFELFRKQITNTEIITFDELFERAKYIVESTDKKIK